jgi:hypothetical protein
MKILNRIINKAARNVEVSTPVQRAFSKQEPDTVQLSTKTSKLQKLKAELFIGLDKATVKSLESMTKVKEFFPKARKIILQRKGIPEKFYPLVYIEDLSDIIGKKPGGIYNNAINAMAFSPETLKLKNRKIFSLYAHELEHFVQNMTIYRTAGLGEKAAKEYASDLSKARSDLDYKTIHSQLENFRKTLVGEMGEIPADSRKGRLAQKYFAEAISVPKLGSSKYFFQITELEAYGRQVFTNFEYLWAKFFKA